MEQQVTEKHVYATEVVDLPSKGVFYPEGSPLRSGTIDVYLMTAKHEDILTSTNLIQKGIVLDKLMDALIATPNVKSSDLLIGDLNAVMVASRILGYGKDYTIKSVCPKCGATVEQTVDLSKLETENEPTPTSANQFTITLPVSKTEIVLRLLTRNDELEIEKESKALKKVNADEIESDATTRLRAMIVSVNGDSSKSTIWNFVENMLVRDARFVREQYRKFVPDVNFNVKLECDCSDNPVSMRLPIGVDFFWPDAGV